MSEQNHKHRWAIILAGGDGTRLKPLTRAITGDDRPKQFCPMTQTFTVVTRTHEPFYQE